MDRRCGGPRGASPASPRAVMQAGAGQSAEAKGQAGDPANASLLLIRHICSRVPNRSAVKTASGQRSGRPAPSAAAWPHSDPEWGSSEMEGMSSSCQVPTQLMGLDTCMCSCGTPCFALTQVPVSPKEASLLAPAPSGCVPLRGSSGASRWGVGEPHVQLPGDQHAERWTPELHTPPAPFAKRGWRRPPPWFGVTSRQSGDPPAG